MKKIIIPVFSLAIISIFSCSKENKVKPNSNNSTTHSSLISSPQGVTVSSRGYLVFNTINDLEAYSKFLEESTLSEIQQYHQSIGFSSRGGSNYSGVGPNNQLNYLQRLEFLFDSKGIVQIEGNLAKITNDNKFILAMKVTSLTNQSYTDLSMGNFSQGYMSRFSAMATVSQNINAASNIILGTGGGYSEPINTPPEQLTPFWFKKWRNEVDTNGDGVKDYFFEGTKFTLFGRTWWTSGVENEGEM